MNNNMYNPQFFQSQFDDAMNRYKDIYNQRYQNSGFIGQYVNSYEEVERAQVSMNGVPTMFVGNGVFWIKKFQNGQPYISAYEFKPINNVGEPKKESVSNNTNNDLNVVLSGLEQAINSINERLSKLEGSENK